MAEHRFTRRPLGDGLSVSHGYAFKGEYFRDSGDLIVLTPGNFIESGGFKLKSKEKFYDGPVPDGYLLRQGDVVVAMTEQSKGLLGSTATLPRDETYLHNQRIGLLEITNPDVLDLRYCYHVLNSPCARQQIQATATGSKVRHTAPERIESVEVRLPPIDVQRKIALSLDSVEQLVENNRRRIEILEEMARLLYREWFVHFRFPGHEDVEMVDSELGPTPEGWTISNLFDIAEIGFGYSFKSKQFTDEGAFPIVRIRDIPRGETTTFSNEESGERYEIHDGDTLIGMDGDFHMCRWSAGLAYLNQRVCRVKATGPLEQMALHLALEEPIRRFNNTIIGTTVAHLGKRHLQEINLAVPGAGISLEVNRRLQPLMLLEINLRKQNRVLREARDLLLPRLVSGELDVSELDLGLETASAVAGANTNPGASEQ